MAFFSNPGPYKKRQFRVTCSVVIPGSVPKRRRKERAFKLGLIIKRQTMMNSRGRSSRVGSLIISVVVLNVISKGIFIKTIELNISVKSEKRVKIDLCI